MCGLICLVLFLSASLQTPVLGQTGAVCVRFDYHVTGSGAVELRVQTTSIDPEAFRVVTGNQGRVWHRAAVDVVRIIYSDRVRGGTRVARGGGRARVGGWGGEWREGGGGGGEGMGKERGWEREGLYVC